MKSQSHVTWECVYHVVIIPKYRKRTLFGQVRQRTGQIIRELAKQKEVEVIEGNARGDHLHMVLSIPPKYSVAYVLGFLKGKSAIRLHYEFGKNRYHGKQKSFWSRGYFVRTIGIDQAMVEKYVREQWKKDRFIDGDVLDLRWE